MASYNVLIVDDDPDMGKLLKRRIEKEAPHFLIETLVSGPAALDYIKQKRVDCILSDYQMPGMNGMELLSNINEQGYDVPLIFITGHGNEDLAREAFKQGAFDYFTKEIGLAYYSRIANSVEQAIKQRRLAAEAIRSASEGVSVEAGENYFRSLVKYITGALGTKIAFVGETSRKDPDTIDTISVFMDGQYVDNFSYELKSTPCDNVVNNRLCVFPKNVQTLFPEDEMLVQLGIESYAGVPLFDSDGEPIGLIVTVDDKPAQNEDFMRSMLQIFASRTSTELERLRTGKPVGHPDDIFKGMIQNSNFGIGIIQDDMFIFANDKLMELTGCGCGDLVEGSDYTDIGFVDDPGRFREEIDMLVKGEVSSVHKHLHCSMADDSDTRFEVICTATLYKGKHAAICIVLEGDVLKDN